MRRFVFRLERILKIRRFRERERELELAAAIARCVELRKVMADCLTRMAEQLRERAPDRGSVDLATLQISEIFRRRLAREHGDAERSLVDRETERKEAQGRYLEVSRDRKVLQRLRERREKQYYRDQKREEFAEMDDISQVAQVRLRGEQER